jgi:phenazine biosynthesis protein phzE
MFAATVVGSPIESACRVTSRYEGVDRRYFGSTIALIGNEDNNEFLDSPITIRTIEIDKKGEVIVKVGSTLVRNSNYEDEVDETEVKIASMIQNITSQKTYSSKRLLSHLEEDDEVLEALGARNQKLSKFWFFSQEDENVIVPKLKDKKILIINNEDDFCFMLKHMLSKLGAVVKIVRYDDYDFDKDKSFITIVGPGPGNPNNIKDKKIKIISEITEKLLNSNKKFISICLGHQVLSKALNFEVVKKSTPYQGVPEKIDFFGQNQIVGFYNTFEAKWDNREDLLASFNPKSKGLNSLRDKNKRFISFQFHPESILSQNGFMILKESIEYMLDNKTF